MEPTAQQIEQLKSIQLDLLRTFISVCEQLDLRYYVTGGTLLGVIRHSGFIPWDDDVDVAMPRADYEIFLEKAQALLPSHLFVQHAGSEPNHVLSFAKLRNSNTTFKETANRRLDINHGVYIDIFALDYYPEDKRRARALERKKGRYNARIRRAFYSTKKANWKGKLLSLVALLRHPSLKCAVRERDKLCRSTPKSGLWVNHGGAWGKREIMPVAWYGEGRMGTFEGVAVRIPTEYDKFLTNVYGDYMQLPPVEKRVGHHYTDVVDLTKSYREYQNPAAENNNRKGKE